MKQNRIIGIVGRKGSGKSNAFVRILSWCPRILLWDATGEHEWVPNTVTDIGGLRNFLIQCHQRARFAVRLVPRSLEEIHGFCETAFGCNLVTIGLEEIPSFSSAGSMPREFERLVLQGRHHGLNIIWTAQRFAEVPRTLTAQCDAFVIFHAGEPIDLQAIEARTGSEFRRAVQELPRYSALVYDVNLAESYAMGPEAARRVLRT